MIITRDEAWKKIVLTDTPEENKRVIFVKLFEEQIKDLLGVTKKTKLFNLTVDYLIKNNLTPDLVQRVVLHNDYSKSTFGLYKLGCFDTNNKIYLKRRSA